MKDFSASFEAADLHLKRRSAQDSHRKNTHPNSVFKDGNGIPSPSTMRRLAFPSNTVS
jgi:hypothetical protein